MGVAKTASDAYWLFKKGKKIRTYGKLIKESIDEDTRTGALVKLGIRGMLEIAGKVLGTSLTSHPYFAYHKVHLEALAQALNASSNQDSAREALKRAVQSADAAAALTSTLAGYRSRNKILLLNYNLFIAGSQTLLLNYAKDPKAAKEMADAGQTPETLRSYVETSLFEWRARECELFYNSVQLLAMAQVELRATEAAMARFDEKMKSMSTKGGNMGKIAAYGMDQDRQWQEFDRMTTSGVGDARAVSDPSGYTRDQVSAIETLSDQLSQNCEVAMSDAAYTPDLILHHMNTP